MPRRVLIASAMVMALFQAKGLQASEGWTVSLGASAWQTLKVPGVRENQFVLQGDTLQVISESSASFRFVEIPRNVRVPSHVSWRWRVDTHSPLSSQAQKGRDDRPLAIHVWFDTEGKSSLLSNLASVVGRPKVGHLLTYVWGATEPAETVLTNPYYDKGRVIIVVGQDGRKGQWHEVRRNIVADYQQAFGVSPDMSKLRYLAISADTDDLMGQSTAAVRAVTFHAR